MMWITLAAMHHQFRDKTYLQKQLDTTKIDYLIFNYYTSFTQMLSKSYIYVTDKLYQHVF